MGACALAAMRTGVGLLEFYTGSLPRARSVSGPRILVRVAVDWAGGLPPAFGGRRPPGGLVQARAVSVARAGGLPCRLRGRAGGLASGPCVCRALLVRVQCVVLC